MSLYSGTYNVVSLTGNAGFDYYFTSVIVWVPAIVTIAMVLKVLSRS